jgi:hypothetical protein
MCRKVPADQPVLEDPGDPEVLVSLELRESPELLVGPELPESPELLLSRGLPHYHCTRT